jgi:hypothetical protein
MSAWEPVRPRGRRSRSRSDAEGALDRFRLARILLRRIQEGHPPFHRHADCPHPILPTWDYQLGKSVTLLASYLLNL